MKRNSRVKINYFMLELVAIIVAAVFIYPVFLMFINSFKTFREVIIDVIALPQQLNIENYFYVIDKMNYPRLFVNNLLITAVGITGIVALSASAAYIIDRSQSKFTRLAFLFIITPMLIPFQTFMITLLKVMNVINLSGSRVGLGIQYWGFGIPMATFIYFNFMKTVPKEIDESAFIDGATTFQTFIYVIFPILKPVTATVVVLDVMWIWNDFLLPLLMVNDSQKTKTLVLAAYNFVGQYNTQWHYAMTAMVLAIVPSLIFFILLQKYIVKGVVAGSLKGQQY